MLSARHHICCWALSAVSAIKYHGLVSNIAYARLISRGLLLPLLTYIVYLVSTSRRPDRPSSLVHWITTSSLMICLGVVADDYASKPERSYLGAWTGPIIHTTLAFSALSTLEAVHQNRDNIQQAHIVTVLAAGRLEARPPYFSAKSLATHLSVQLGHFASFAPLVASLNTLLRSINGPDVTCASVWVCHMGVKNATLGGAVVFYFVVGAFLDVVETIFAAAQTYLFPATRLWGPSTKPLISPRVPYGLHIVSSLPLWAVWYGLGRPTNDLVLSVLSWRAPFAG